MQLHHDDELAGRKITFSVPGNAAERNRTPLLRFRSMKNNRPCTKRIKTRMCEYMYNTPSDTNTRNYTY